MTTLTDVTRELQSKLLQALTLNARVLFDFGDNGQLWLDATKAPPELREGRGDGDPDTTLSCSLDTFVSILHGDTDPNIAVLMGRLKIRGSLGIALKLSAMLE